LVFYGAETMKKLVLYGLRMLGESFEYVRQKDDLMLFRKRKYQVNAEIRIENAYLPLRNMIRTNRSG